MDPTLYLMAGVIVLCVLGTAFFLGLARGNKTPPRPTVEQRVRYATDDALADHKARGCEHCTDAQRKAWPT